jgi:uncharacterized delta-60 repeat protein
VNRLTRRSGDAVRARRRIGLTAAVALVSLAAPAAAFAGAAISADSDPDVFGVDGKVAVHGTDRSDDFLVGLSLASDGKILASGFAVENRTDGQPQFVTVTRRNADGSPDRGFGENGVAVLRNLPGGEATHVVPTADGGVVGSGFEIVNGLPSAVAFRLDAQGRPVPGFGQNGIARFPAPGLSLGTRVQIQPDGKIVMAGLSARTLDNIDISVRRLLPNGARDTQFGISGEKTIDLSGDDEANSVALQPDGKIVVAGQTDKNRDAVAARLNANGSLDTGFGSGGLTLLNAKGVDHGTGLALQPDGKIAVVGDTTAAAGQKDAVLFRLLSNGRPDTSFNGTGQVVFNNPGNDGGFGVGVGPENSLVISAFQNVQQNTVTDSFLNRATSTGKPDPAFGTAGTVRLHNPEATFELGLEIQPDGKIVTTGRRGDFNGSNVVDSIGTISRFNTDGSFDTTAGLNG